MVIPSTRGLAKFMQKRTKKWNCSMQVNGFIVQVKITTYPPEWHANDQALHGLMEQIMHANLFMTQSQFVLLCMKNILCVQSNCHQFSDHFANEKLHFFCIIVIQMWRALLNWLGRSVIRSVRGYLHVMSIWWIM